MKIENQVCNISDATELNELGVIQDSLFYHIYPHMNSGWKIYLKDNFNPDEDGVEYYSAYSVAELFQMLPEETISSKHFGSKGIQLGTEGYYWESEYGGMSGEIGITQAESLAKLLISFIKDDLVPIEDANYRLNG